jgi:hypothetical protein
VARTRLNKLCTQAGIFHAVACCDHFLFAFSLNPAGFSLVFAARGVTLP